ncbi:hypothetical protein [Paracoccus zhejiangensis]|uniref:hypothetical protein n=1 Tax=Paracoccus zhejiangensis TaxID=1077935 RepID=UPI0012FFFEFF|nr:hypothetical protein [Paracoccus zhejiangensis]
MNAAIWSLLLGYMFLPPSFAIDLPVVPAMGKYEIASLSTAVMLWLGLGRKVVERDPMAHDARPVMPFSTKFLVFLLLISAVFTVLNNSDALVSGISYRPGMQISDVVANAMLQLIELIPFFIGFSLLSTPHQTRKLLVALMIAVLIYSMPMLLEVRLSPQLNTWIYGYFQHEFAQVMRYGGFRPIVFMTHPIWVASFATMGFIATLCLTRAFQTNARMMLVICYLIILLILCKTMTAILMAALAMPLVLMASPRAILSISVVVAIGVFVYPVLRLLDFVPTEGILGFIDPSQPERAASLKVRFDNEFILLTRALERPFFGWGSWGRNFPVDPVSGRYGAIADGAWVITLGSRGILGYVAQFGLLISPIIIMWQRSFALFRRFDKSDLLMIATLTLMLAVNLIELIPNATLTPLTWLLNGTILGHAARLQYSRALRRRWQREDSDALAKKEGLRPAL